MKKEFVYSFVGMFATAIFLLSILAPPASAQVKVGDIQAAVKASGATWVAAENPITKLTPGEQKQLLGVKEGPKTTSNPPTTVPSAYGLPPSLDWRNNGGNYVTSVKSQGSCGSCWAFSAVAALESATLIANNTPNTDLNLSEQVLVSCCYATCSPDGDCRGGYPEKAADFLRDTGVPLQSCYPYRGDGLCSNACPNWQASAYKAKSWRYVVNNSQGEAPTVDKIRSGLQNGPLAITMAVYDDFFFYSFGVYKYARGILDGYHAILVVGYDDVGQYFIAKNSWGTSWGEQGFFRIAYSEVTGQPQFGYETIAYYVGGDNPTCTYTLNSTSQTVTAAAGTGSVNVTAVSGCAWTAKSNASWITVTGANSGSGTAKVNYAVAANSGASRTGTMIIGGQTFTVTQSGSSTCTYTISPTANSLGAAGGTGSVNVAAPSGCVWSATSGAGWITITSGASGSGNGGAGYTVAANTSTSQRTGSMTIANKAFTVTQSGMSCSYSISPASNSLNATGASGTVNVIAASGCTWNATSGANWITITSASNGSGNGSVSYSVAANTATAQRAGTMAIANQTFTVTQAGQAACAYGISPTAQNFTTAGGTGTFSVSSGSGCAWSATSNASWLTTSQGVRASGNGSVSYSVAANTGAARTGTITVADKNFTVTQAGITPTCPVTLVTWMLNLPYAFIPRTTSLQVTAASTCSWNASSNVPWITFPSGTSGKGNGSVTITVDVNNGASRTGTVTINGSTVTVNEGGAPGK